MKRNSAVFLQAVILLVGAAVLGFMLWEPHLEGRNAHATLFEIYFKDPFLAYAYIGSLPFFAAIRQAFKVAGYAGQGKLYSPEAAKALRTIKYCALTVVGFVALGEVFLLLGESDDRAGGVFMGVLITAASLIAAAAASKLEKPGH